MPLTPTQFKAEYTEFRLLTDGVVQTKLDAAYLRVGDSWGDLRDHGASLLAAHMLALSPLAEPSRKSVKGGGRTVYLDEFERVLRQARIFGTSGEILTLPSGAD